MNWTRERLAWVAGLFEGEGCIAHSRNGKYGQWFLVVASTDLDVLERLQEWTGVGNISGPTQRSESHKPCWTWRSTKRDETYALLIALYPWLGARRQERARECLKGISTNPHAFVGRRCKQGHRWAPDTVVKKHYGGRSRRVCRACLDQGVIEIRSEVS